MTVPLLTKDVPLASRASAASSPFKSKYRPVMLISSAEDPEGTLRELFVSGDPGALKAAYDQHGPAVYSFASKAIGTERAHDLTQEVFLSAWRARTSFNPERGSLGGWLIGITKNRLIDSYRKAGRRVAEAELSDAVQQSLASADDPTFGALADRMVLLTALSTLPIRQSEVLKMAFWGDFTQQQIADETGLPLGTVKSDMRRGLMKLRAELEKTDGER